MSIVLVVSIHHMRKIQSVVTGERRGGERSTQDGTIYPADKMKKGPLHYATSEQF